MTSSTPKRARRGLHLDTFVSTPRTTINQRQTSISRNSQREAAGSPEVLNELLSVCKGILSRLTAIENLQREQHLQHHASGMSSVRSTPATISSPTPTTTTGSTEEIEDLFVVPDDLVQFCERSRQNSLSVGHYATVITKKIFTESERENRNCTGTRSKLPLDPAKLGLVKKLVFRFYCIKDDEKERVWKNCVTRIDEMLRRKPKSSEASGGNTQC